jgi:uncharacterized membrane protein
MKLISDILVYIHIIFGFTSLVLFWVPIFARKGGKTHRKVGLLYVYAMSVVAFTAFVLSIENLLTNHMTMGVFLGFLSLLTARPLLLGIECLSSKNELKIRYKRWHISTSVLLTVLGAGLMYYGLTTSNSLSIVITVFGFLGLTALPEIYSLLKAEFKGTKKWLENHITNMCTAGIAAHTAFLVFGGQSLLPNYQNQLISIVMWISPTVIGLLGIQWAKHKYVKSTINSQVSRPLSNLENH